MCTAEVICKVSHYYLAESETVFRQFQFDLTNDLLMSFLLMKIPTKLNSTIFDLVDAVDLFEDLNRFVKFFCATLFRYYCKSSDIPDRVIKFFQKKVNPKKFNHQTGDYALTFNKLAYFSGCFDRGDGTTGLYLPLPFRLDLVSRCNKTPHPTSPVRIWVSLGVSIPTQATPPDQAHSI